MKNIEKKMQQFIPGIVSLDDAGPELLYFVGEDRSVQMLVTYPDGTETRGPDKPGTLKALLGKDPDPGWYTASGRPFRLATPPRGDPRGERFTGE